MSFGPLLTQIDLSDLQSRISAFTEADVEGVLAKPKLTVDDFPILVSPAAALFLEAMAQKARRITRLRFGKVMNLYAPLYISNACVNACAYCGFNITHNIHRQTLSLEEVWTEARALHHQSMRHILLVSGESPEDVPISMLETIGKRLSRIFASVAIEVYPLSVGDYQRLAHAGIVGIALYQETYIRSIYEDSHKGPKADFDCRLDSLERAAAAGFRELGLGTLLGLSDFRLDTTLLAQHAHYLMKKFWRTRISISFPRIREAEGHFKPDVNVTDQELAQIIFAFRLVFPDADLVLSTREPAEFRDGMAELGITRMSAGSKTNPGGYALDDGSLKQFKVSDDRSPSEIADMLKTHDLEPVWKDFDPAMAEALKMA